MVSPDGYDALGQVSSAYNLTLFARSGLQKEDFWQHCSTVRAPFPGRTTTEKGKKTRRSFEIQDADRWRLRHHAVPWNAGVKNGNTTNAGATFTGLAERDGRALLVTVTNPQKKFHNEVYSEAAGLLDWGLGAVGKVRPAWAFRTKLVDETGHAAADEVVAEVEAHLMGDARRYCRSLSAMYPESTRSSW